MNTKFDTLLKIRRNDLDVAEIELSNINNSIRQQEDYIRLLKSQLKTIVRTDIKVYNELLSIKDSIIALKDDIAVQEAVLSDLYTTRAGIVERYNLAILEYEKINYLCSRELDLMAFKLRRKEQDECDEIAGILHYIRNN